VCPITAAFMGPGDGFPLSAARAENEIATNPAD
jgi:hypothetical protein